MNAQQAWKSEYYRFKNELVNGWEYTAFEIIHNARRYVREAALERALAAANRRIDALELELYEAHEQAYQMAEVIQATI